MTDYMGLDKDLLFLMAIIWIAILIVGGAVCGLRAASRRVMRIHRVNVKTSHEWLNRGWVAWDDDAPMGLGYPKGHGKTEEAAIADLLEQIERK